MLPLEMLSDNVFGGGFFLMDHKSVSLSELFISL